ncbi:hypothetical protein ACIODS_32500 [Micromonospora chalcea]|uniref:hypothetical protein n=1 Tax=Micromonospora chalcea TaxID=1874 RepID=UPI0038258D69
MLGRELAHVYHQDILISSVAAALAGMITMLADLVWFLPGGACDDKEQPAPGLLGGLLMLLIAPIAATLIQLAISRKHAAGTGGAALSGDPQLMPPPPDPAAGQHRPSPSARPRSRGASGPRRRRPSIQHTRGLTPGQPGGCPASGPA